MAEQAKSIIIHLYQPDAGQSAIVPIDADNMRLALDFEPDRNATRKEGLNLEFFFKDGGKLILEGYYAHFANKTLPVMLTEGGNELDGEHFLASLREDLLIAYTNRGQTIRFSIEGRDSDNDLCSASVSFTLNDAETPVIVRLTATEVIYEDGSHPTDEENGGVYGGGPDGEDSWIIYTAAIYDAAGREMTARNAVSVSLSNGAVIRIPAGASSGSSDLLPYSDEDPYVENKSVSAYIASAREDAEPGAVGSFEKLTWDETPAETRIIDSIDAKLTISPSGVLILSLPSGGTIRDSGKQLYFSKFDPQAEKMAQELANMKWGKMCRAEGNSFVFDRSLSRSQTQGMGR